MITEPHFRPDPDPESVRLIGDAHRALNDYRSKYSVHPVEIRMNGATAFRIAQGVLMDVVKDEDIEGGRLLDLAISLDQSLEYGEFAIWPTSDEWAVTALANGAR